MRSISHVFVLIVLFGGCTPHGPTPEQQAAEAEELTTLVEAYFEDNLKLNPIAATFIGDARYNDQFSNTIGDPYRTATEEMETAYLERLATVDRALLTGQARLTYDVFKRGREVTLEGLQYPGYLLPINQFFSTPNFFAQLGSGQSVQPFRTPKDYDDFLGRIDGFAVWMDQAVTNMRQGIAQGYVQPRVLMEKTLPQLEAHAVDDVEQSLFYGPIRALPADFNDADRERLAQAYREAIATKVIPAYRKVHDFIHDEYLPQTRESVGLSGLPGGTAWYNYQIKVNTTTDMDAEAIHTLGLQEVARIREEMMQVKDEVGFEGDLPAFFEHLKAADEFYYTNEEELLQGYRDLQDVVNAVLPPLFDVAPKADYEVRAVEAFRAQSAAGASYQPPTPDGSRPGIFYVNTFNLRGQPKYGMETLSLHEASPGHHFQIAIQQEIEGLPRFRRFGGFTAFSEGWALYAESLGKEMGLFTDPYSYYGRLSDEMLRAMRLVVDTGLHAKGWTRDQALQYMLDNSSMAETDVVAEVERYMAIPGQALAYKVGQLKIAELRAHAEETLGSRFDLKAYHREVLTGGAVPMDVLDTKINEWIAAQ